MKSKKVLNKYINDKGFTLVEVIVVIVIIAILAGIAVPALTGYIKKASDKALFAEARQCVIASQTLASERHSTKDAVTNEIAKTAAFKSEVTTLAETPADGVLNSVTYNDSVVTELYYTNYGKTVRYFNGKYTIVDSPGEGGGTGGDEGTTPLPEITQTSFLASFQGLTGVTVQVYQNGYWQTYGTNHDNFALIEGIENKASSLRVVKGGSSYTFTNVMPNTTENKTPFVVPISKITITNNSGVVGLQVGLIQSDWVYARAPLAEGGTLEYTVINNGNPFTLSMIAQGQGDLRIAIPTTSTSINISDYTYSIDFPSNITVNRINQSNWIYNPVPSDVTSLKLLKNNLPTIFYYTPNGGSQTSITVPADGSQPAW